jgi:acetylornithine deacetylase/succinyl-diaminopimelate desuccinylase-like protein
VAPDDGTLTDGGAALGQHEVVRLLRELLRFDTSNPPGNERPCCEFVADLLRKGGVEPKLLEKERGRTSILARIEGDGSLPPLLLSAHLDVVPAVEPDWRYPPFAGELVDGYIWGRGAVDMKHMAAMSLRVLLDLKASGARLKRDVIFAGVADQEAGGRLGAGFLVDEHADEVKAEFCLTELGGMAIPMARATLVPVQVAERGFEWFTIRVRGSSGHGSVPSAGSAIEKLAHAVEQLCKKPLGYHLTPTARDFIHAVAEAQPAPANTLLLGLLNKNTAQATLRLVSEERRPAFRAMLFDTAAPTMLSAGVKVNVVPHVAEARIDGRFLPGVTREEFLAEVRAVIGEGFELEPMQCGPPLEMPFDSGVLDAIRQVFARRVPDAKVVPYLMPGMTDAKHYARSGIPTYGFAPVALEKDELFAELYHAPNERISAKGLVTGLSWLQDVVGLLAT